MVRPWKERCVLPEGAGGASQGWLANLSGHHLSSPKNPPHLDEMTILLLFEHQLHLSTPTLASVAIWDGLMSPTVVSPWFASKCAQTFYSTPRLRSMDRGVKSIFFCHSHLFCPGSWRTTIPSVHPGKAAIPSSYNHPLLGFADAKRTHNWHLGWFKAILLIVLRTRLGASKLVKLNLAICQNCQKSASSIMLQAWKCRGCQTRQMF